MYIRNFSETKLDVLKVLYLDFGLNQKQVAKIFGVCKKTVCKQLKKLGILRSRSEVNMLNWKYGQKYNHDKSGFKKGKEHVSWKGGRFEDSRGYIRIYAPNHPRAKKHSYVSEHILVWEKTHEKLLPMDFLIHHLNGIRNDNRPENLFAMPRKRHISDYPNTYIRELQKKIRELEMRND